MENEITFTKEQVIELYSVLDKDEALDFLHKILIELSTDRNSELEFLFTKTLIKRRQLEILDAHK